MSDTKDRLRKLTDFYAGKAADQIVPYMQAEELTLGATTIIRLIMEKQPKGARALWLTQLAGIIGKMADDPRIEELPPYFRSET